jgi:pimeloyl-ACP methyl ester carboxylesterase
MTQKPNRKSRPLVPATPAPRGWTASIRANRSWLLAGAGAAMLAGTALFNRASAQRAEAETPPAGQFVEVDGVRLHYVDRGEGPAVVLLHGNGVMLQDFEASGVLGLAAAGPRVVAIDRPGFGYSERPRTTLWTPAAQADLIARALKRIGIDRAIVVGHSWGTMVALAMALDHADAVSGLVLLSGYYYGTARPDVVPASLPAIPLFGDLLAHTLAPLAGLLTGPAAVRAAFAPAPVPDRFADLPAAMALRPSQMRAAAADSAMMVPAAASLSRRYAALELPVIVMAGEGDRIVHADRHSQRLAGEIEGAELRLVPAQGHMFHYSVPEQVVAAIADLAGRDGA